MGANIDFLREAKTKAEAKITASVALALRELEEETGFNVSGVTLSFADVTSFGDKQRRILITGTEIEMKI